MSVSPNFERVSKNFPSISPQHPLIKAPHVVGVRVFFSDMKAFKWQTIIFPFPLCVFVISSQVHMGLYRHPFCTH